MSKINSSSWLNRVTMIVALAMGAYHLISTQYLLVDPLPHQNIHLAFALTLVFLAGLKGKRWFVSLGFLLLALAGTGYIYIFTEDLQMHIGFPTAMDILISTIMVVVALEAARQAIGPAFTIVGLIAIAYAFVGYYLPPPLHTIRIGYSKLLSELCSNLSGVYGTVLAVSVNYIFLFVLLGGLIGVSSASGSSTSLVSCAGGR